MNTTTTDRVQVSCDCGAPRCPGVVIEIAVFAPDGSSTAQLPS